MNCRFKNLNTMKKMFTAIFMLLACSVMAQYSINARVVDGKTNVVLSGATIKIADKIYVTDQFGVAQANGLPAGEYRVEVKFFGYRL